MSDSGQWFDHPILELSPEQRARLDQLLRAEGIPATFGPTAVRTDIAYEARVATLIEQARATAPAGPPTPYGGGYPAPAPAPPNNSNAIVALVLGIASLAFCQLIGPAAVIVGQRARREIARTGEQGDGMALAGVITGAIASALLAVALLAVVVLVVLAVAGSA